jgi:phosphoribosylcarboxyaminoimidazole (NCAIR) mutase
VFDIACGPYEVLPEWVFDKVFCPAVETDPVTGEAKVAQVGLRRIEAALHQGYKKDEVFVANPEHLAKSIGPDTKVVGINVMDPLGMAPVTTTMAPEKLSYVAMKFKRMCADIIQLKKKYDFKVAVGGNGAWELAKSDRMKVHGIDTVVVGEADELALDLFGDLERGDAPELMHCFVKNIQNIPEITGPTVNSLIEAMRGCGRGCDFCDVNKRSKKDLPLDRLQREARLMCEAMNCECITSYDIGISGLHRTFPVLKEFIKSDVNVVIVAAGMEGALASVVSSTVNIPVIGVPTSVGYGYGEKGVAALASMLQSCALGLSVVNIDNGIGAGAIASKIANLLSKNNSEKKS